MIRARPAGPIVVRMLARAKQQVSVNVGYDWTVIK